jgi:hypothetical protein
MKIKNYNQTRISILKQDNTYKYFILFVFVAVSLLAIPYYNLVKEYFNPQTESTGPIVEADNDKYFQIAVLSDTQYYTSEKHNGTMAMFHSQIDWITANQKKEKIAYVVHLGDVSDHGDQYPVEWERAKEAMYKLEKPLPGLPNGIPYGVALGNHDSTPNGDPTGTKNGYEEAFGRKRFLGRNYYGGSFKDSNVNDNHYDLFSANGEDFIVLYIGFNEQNDKKPGAYKPDLEQEVFAWGTEILNKYAKRKAIIVSHSILAKGKGSNSNEIPGQGANDKPGIFTSQGRKIYHHFKNSPNVFLMLCGHRSGEALKIDTYNGHTIKSILTDYQSRKNEPFGDKDRNGGNGILRLMKIDQTKQELSTTTFVSKEGKIIEELDGDSKFTVPLYK